MNRDLDYVMFTKEQLKARVQEIGAQENRRSFYVL